MGEQKGATYYAITSQLPANRCGQKMIVLTRKRLIELIDIHREDMEEVLSWYREFRRDRERRAHIHSHLEKLESEKEALSQLLAFCLKHNAVLVVEGGGGDEWNK